MSASPSSFGASGRQAKRRRVQCCAPAPRTNVRRPRRGAEPSQQAEPHPRDTRRGAEPPPGKGAAEGHSRARPRPCGRAGNRWPRLASGGRGVVTNRGSTLCKPNCPCTSRPDARRNRSGAVYSARARPSGVIEFAVCTGPLAGLPRAIGTPTSMGSTAARPSKCGARLLC